MKMLEREIAQRIWAAVGTLKQIRGGWADIRSAVKAGPGIPVIEYHIHGAPRARCRVCGKSINGGSGVLLVVDPRDNLWTSERWWIHAQPCGEEAT